jgi:hypothetical protein
MRRSHIGVVCLAALAAAALLSPAEAGGGKKTGKRDKVVGVRWEYKLVEVADKDAESSGTFRAHNGKLFKGAKEIGVYEDVAKDHVKAEVKEGKLKGKWELRQTKAKPPTWRGELTRDDGSKAKMIVTFLSD